MFHPELACSPHDVTDAALEHGEPCPDHVASNWLTGVLPSDVGEDADPDADADPLDRVLDSLCQQANLNPTFFDQERLSSALPLTSDHLFVQSCSSSRIRSISQEESPTWHQQHGVLSSPTCTQDFESQKKQSLASEEGAAGCSQNHKQGRGQGEPVIIDRDFNNVLTNGETVPLEEQLLAAVLCCKSSKLLLLREVGREGMGPSGSQVLGSQLASAILKAKKKDVPGHALRPLIEAAQSAKKKIADLEQGPHGPIRGENDGGLASRLAALIGNEDEGQRGEGEKREGGERERMPEMEGRVGGRNLKNKKGRVTTQRGPGNRSAHLDKEGEAHQSPHKTIVGEPASVQTQETADASTPHFHSFESWARCNPAPTAGVKRRPLQELAAAMDSDKINEDPLHQLMDAVLVELMRQYAPQTRHGAQLGHASSRSSEAKDLLPSFLERTRLLVERERLMTSAQNFAEKLGMRDKMTSKYTSSTFSSLLLESSIHPGDPSLSTAGLAPQYSISAFEFLPPVHSTPSLRISTCVEILSLAHAFEAKDKRAIVSATKRLTQNATPHGHFYQRVAAYALKAFELRRSGQPLTLTFPPSQEATSEANTNDYLTRVGWIPYAEIVNTSTLIQALKGYSKVHIILLSDGGGVDWSTLFSALSKQAGGAPFTRVTCVRHFRGGGAPNVPMPPNTPDNKLVMAALQAGIPLEHCVLRVAPKDFNPELVKIGKDEALAVAACWHFVLFPDDKVLPMNPRNAVLRWIHSLSPKVLVLTEPDANYNSTGFLDRMGELAERRIRICEAWDSVVPQNATCRAAGELLTMHLIIDCIANEGIQRFARDERLEQWVDRMAALGFSMVKFPSDVWRALEILEQSNPIVEIHRCGEIVRFLQNGVPCSFSCVWLPA